MNVTPQPRISNPLDAANRTVYEGGLLADQLGLLKARNAEARVAEDTVKQQLIEMATEVPGKAVAFEGTQFRATVSFGTKTVTDYRAIIDTLIEKHGVSAAVVAKLHAKFTQTAEGVPTVRVVARKSTH
jgi:hypothetical protein